MNLNEPLLAELQFEAANTRKMLERVPAESFGWKPHEKSMSLHVLAYHIGDLHGWLSFVIKQPSINMAGMNFLPSPQQTKEELLQHFDDKLADGIASLQSVTDEEMFEKWKLLFGEHVVLELPKIAMLRSLFSHIIHHRGQLSVYLRMLNVPVPGMYGPSADDSSGF